MLSVFWKSCGEFCIYDDTFRFMILVCNNVDSMIATTANVVIKTSESLFYASLSKISAIDRKRTLLRTTLLKWCLNSAINKAMLLHESFLIRLKIWSLYLFATKYTLKKHISAFRQQYVFSDTTNVLILTAPKGTLNNKTEIPWYMWSHYAYAYRIKCHIIRD